MFLLYADVYEPQYTCLPLTFPTIEHRLLGWLLSDPEWGTVGIGKNFHFSTASTSVDILRRGN
jgi:hypothetical protein